MAINDYQIIREIGSGGMGSVYLARDLRLNRNVAIKKVKLSEQSHEGFEENIIRRFYREAKIIANLRHPHIVSIYELGQITEDEHYIVIEYLEGKSVADLIREKIILPLDFVLKIALQACDALAYMHKKNIVHRDIKPDNLICCDNDELKIIDFGLARIEDNQQLTQAGIILGSVAYISPEQINTPKNVDGRADIYSLGVTMYQSLSASLPFKAGTMWEFILEINKGNSIPIEEAAPIVPGEVARIIMKMIAPIDKRYKNMEEVKKDLSNYIFLNNLSKSETNKDKDEGKGPYYFQINSNPVNEKAIAIKPGINPLLPPSAPPPTPEIKRKRRTSPLEDLDKTIVLTDKQENEAFKKPENKKRGSFSRKFDIYESGSFLGIEISKTSKENALAIMKEYCEFKLEQIEKPNGLYFHDSSLYINFSPDKIVREMIIDSSFKGQTSEGLRIGDHIRRAVNLYGAPEKTFHNCYCWQKLLVFYENDYITHFRLRDT